MQNANQESEGFNYRIAQIVRDGSEKMLDYDYDSEFVYKEKARGIDSFL